MPTFIPPTTEGKRVGTSPLMRFYGAWAQGLTVWKDSQGVWHESSEPYQGGAIHQSHNNWINGVGPITTTTGPDEGLATAQVVYLGGHVHTIASAEAADLTAAGYGAYIT